jgi:hypothetical protein
MICIESFVGSQGEMSNSVAMATKKMQDWIESHEQDPEVVDIEITSMHTHAYEGYYIITAVIEIELS